MRIISKQRLSLYAEQHADAASALERWHSVVKNSEWINLTQTRSTFPSADPVKVASGKTVHIFNLNGGAYRLVTAIHYDRQKVFILEFLTHAQYSQNRWKENL